MAITAEEIEEAAKLMRPIIDQMNATAVEVIFSFGANWAINEMDRRKVLETQTE